MWSGSKQKLIARGSQGPGAGGAAAHAQELPRVGNSTFFQKGAATAIPTERDSEGAAALPAGFLRLCFYLRVLLM